MSNLESPLFSVVLPTKDRPQLVEKCVRSIAKQTFHDFEIVVADNGGEQALNPVCLFEIDPRVRYVRTGGLIMCDNWQAAYDASKGKAVIVIEDKMVLAPECLEILVRHMREGGFELLTFYIGGYSFTGPLGCQTEKSAIPIETKEMLEAVADCRLDHYSKLAPRTLNMAFCRSLADRVQKKVGRLFRPMSPDYSCGALLLAASESYGHIPSVLAKVNRGPSSGSNYALGGNIAKASTIEFGGCIHELVKKLPSQSLLFGNTLLGELLDFLEAGGIPRLRLGPREPDYWVMLLSEALVALKNSSSETRDAFECFREIRKKGMIWRIGFTAHLLQRFIKGWPGRQLRMRQNLADFKTALWALWGNINQKSTSAPDKFLNIL